MITLLIKKITTFRNVDFITQTLLLGLLFWLFIPRLLPVMNETAGTVDESIWLLLLFSMLSFLLFILISAWLLKNILRLLELPSPGQLVLQFKKLTLCQQFVFYWASFALLLLAAILSLMAVL